MYAGCRDDSLFVVLKNKYECKKKNFYKKSLFFLSRFAMEKQINLVNKNEIEYT